MAKLPEPGDRVITVDEDGDLVEMTVMSVVSKEEGEFPKIQTDSETFPELKVRWSESEECWADIEVEVDIEDDE